MKCECCGKEIDMLSCHFIPQKHAGGYGLCFECSKREKIITLV